MRDLIRLIIIILFLPVVLVFLGPALVLAALRGRQWMGPITLDSSQYGVVGRVGMFLLGLAIWLLVWSGLLWLSLEAIVPTQLNVSLPPAPTIFTKQVNETATATAAPLAPAATSTPTTQPLTRTATLPPPAKTSTATPVLPATTATATLQPTSTPTATELFNETLATNTPDTSATEPPTATPSSGEAADTVTPSATITQTVLSPAVRQAVLATVGEANGLLRDALAEASEENLKNLGSLWQGKTLDSIGEFAVDMNSRYSRPFNVDFEYVTPPAISDRSVPGQVVVFTREKWSYGGPSTTNEEAFEFIYTLIPQGDHWVISRYTYRNIAQ